MRRLTLLLGLLACAGGTALPAGEYNGVLSIGDAAPAWKALPGTDGKSHSLDDLKSHDIVVVLFTCASCPYAVEYEGRINELISKYQAAGKVAVVPICVNRVAADQLPALTERVQSEHLKFHYLYDESQKIARDFGAIFTPEFYVFDRERKLVYMGAMDDNTDPKEVKQHYVDAAIQAALRGEKPKVAETIAVGCRVRYARERRN